MTTKPKFKKLRLPVSFTGFAAGDEIMSIGFQVGHEHLVDNINAEGAHAAAVARAYELFCCRQLTATLTLGRRELDEDQGDLLETDVKFSETFDVAMKAPTTKTCGGKLACVMTADGPSEMVKFAKREGYLTITSLMEALDLGDDEDDADEKDAERPMLAGGKKAK